MKLLTILLTATFLMAKEATFGAISTVNEAVMKKRLTPLIRYISKVVKKDLKFATGFDYSDTIWHFKRGDYDFGFIAPSSFILATKDDKKRLKIIAGLNNKEGGYFHSVVVVRKDSNITKLSDLEGKTFAFGSPKSTLAYFLPMYELQINHIVEKLSNYLLLGKHDRVAKYVIMGKYDAGAIKESVAKRYSKYLKIIHKSQPIPDFLVVASSNIPDELVKKIQIALLKKDSVKAAKAIKSSATGFRKRSYKDYQKLTEIMETVINANKKFK